MRIIGIILILVILLLYFLWIRYARGKEGVRSEEEGDTQVFNIEVKGVYNPDVIEAKVSKTVRINFIRKEDSECSRYVNFPDFHIRKELPKGEKVSIEFTPEKKGEFFFTCDMSMYQGRLIVK